MTVLTCLRCGHVGTDVAITTVDLETEARAAGERIRDVEVEMVTELRHVREVTKVVVPERYGTEYRCRDRIACARRYWEQQQPPPAAEPVVEEQQEDESWIA